MVDGILLVVKFFEEFFSFLEFLVIVYGFLLIVGDFNLYVNDVSD